MRVVAFFFSVVAACGSAGRAEYTSPEAPFVVRFPPGVSPTPAKNGPTGYRLVTAESKRERILIWYVNDLARDGDDALRTFAGSFGGNLEAPIDSIDVAGRSVRRARFRGEDLGNPIQGEARAVRAGSWLILWASFHLTGKDDDELAARQRAFLDSLRVTK